MKVQSDILYERYLRTYLTKDRTIGDFYNSILDDISRQYQNMRLKELVEAAKPKKKLARYYDKYLFDSSEATVISDIVYEGVLIMYARLCHLTYALSYNVLLPKGYLLNLIVETSLIEQIFASVFKDNHTNAILMRESVTANKQYYQNKETRLKYVKKANAERAIRRSILNTENSLTTNKQDN